MPSARPEPGLGRRVELGLTVGIIAVFSAVVLAMTAADRAALRADAAGPAGEAPPPETGHLRQHKRGGE